MLKVSHCFMTRILAGQFLFFHICQFLLSSVALVTVTYKSTIKNIDINDQVSVAAKDTCMIRRKSMQRSDGILVLIWNLFSHYF